MNKTRLGTVSICAFAACLLLVFICGSGGAAPQAKGKPAPAPRATVTIVAGSDIYPDRNEAYVDGLDKVAAQIFTAGSYDMTLDLINSSRFFNVTMVDPDDQGAIHTYASGYYITIRQIGNMLLDETKWTRAHVYVEHQIRGTTVFSWCGGLDFTPPAGVTLLDTTNTCGGSDFLVSAKCNQFIDGKGCTDWTVSTSDGLDPEETHVAPLSMLTYTWKSVTERSGPFRTSFQLHVQR